MQKIWESDATTVPVPDHTELRAGTLLSINRQSGLPGPNSNEGCRADCREFP